MNIESIYELFLKSSGVSTDTRSDLRDKIFIALKGANFNGNTFAMSALEQGALAVIIDEEDYYLDEKTILVENTLQFLQKLANYHRHQLKAKIIALTGSNGKTTTKEIMASILSEKYKLSYTSGNYNNHIGVPLTLLSFDNSLEIGIVEMGANHVGEIKALCAIAEPEMGLITNIGKAHIGEFGGQQNIIKGKSEMYQFLKSNQGIIFYNSDDALLTSLVGDYQPSVPYSNNYADNSTTVLTQVQPEIVISYQDDSSEMTINCSLGGHHNYENIKTGIAIGKYFGLDPKQIRNGLENFIVPDKRSQWIKTKKNKVFLDAYNANPSSMKTAIEYFALLQGEKKIILGEMLELGDFSRDEHQRLIDFCHDLEIESYFIGRAFDESHGSVFEDKQRFLAAVDISQWENCLVLLKGSRGIKLEELTDFL